MLPRSPRPRAADGFDVIRARMEELRRERAQPAENERRPATAPRPYAISSRPAPEEVYLRAYDSVGEARAALGRYLDFYNRKRPHSSLDARTPDHAYFERLPQVAAA